MTDPLAESPIPDDRVPRVDILRRYGWRIDKSTSTFYKNKYRIGAGVVRLLPLDDLEYSCKYPERVWP